MSSVAFTGRVAQATEKACRPLARGDYGTISRAILPEVKHYHEIEDAVAVFQRTAAYTGLWAHHPHNKLFPESRNYVANTVKAAGAAIRPPSVPAREAVAGLHGVGFMLTSEQVGRFSYATPMSAVGSGCSGSLLHLTTTKPCGDACLRARLGRISFAAAPFAGEEIDGVDPEWGYPNGSRHDDTARHIRLSKKYGRAGTCPFCGAENDDPFHLLCECRNSCLRQLRREMRLSLLDMLMRLSRMLESGIRRSTNNRSLISSVRRRARSLRRYIGNLRAKPGRIAVDINYTAFRMLLATPFPATLPALLDDILPFSLRVGRLFDAMVLPNSYLRKPANMIVSWGSEWVNLFAHLRHLLLIENYRRQQQGQ
jgi:hypothetical protein